MSAIDDAIKYAGGDISFITLHTIRDAQAELTTLRAELEAAHKSDGLNIDRIRELSAELAQRRGEVDALRRTKTIMKHARPDYNRIQDPALKNPSLLSPGSTPIGEDEPVFLLRAQDRTAAQVVAYWAWLNESVADYDPKAVAFAKSHARLMEQWQPKKTADVP